MSDLLRRLLPTVWGRAPEAAPQDFVVSEAGLRFTFVEGNLAILTTFGGPPLFTLENFPGVRPSTVRTERGGNPALLIHLGQDLTITCVQFGQTPPGQARALVRATRKRQPEGGQALEFTFAHERDQVRYLAELVPGLVPQGFREHAPVEAVFTEVPPLSQMVAFLKAILHQRRTALRSLKGLARRCADPRVRAGIDDFGARLNPNHDFNQPLIEELRQALEQQGRPVNLNTLIALCLMADLFLERIDSTHVDDLVNRDRPLLISEDAAAAAARFLGGRPVRAAGSDADRALGFLWAAVAERSARTILEDLAEDSGSETSRARVRRLLERVPPDQVLSNDEQEALRSYLAARGRTIHADTLAALCLYVDFEAGILVEEDIDALTPARSFVDHSLYALLAVAGAFEVEFRCLVLGDEDESVRWRGLECLVERGEQGVLARFLESGQPGFHTRHLPDLAAVQQARAAGLGFTGEVLVSFPVLDYLEVSDLRAFLGQQVPLLACFQSEDRSIRWRVIESASSLREDLEVLTGPFGFIEGFRAYRFHGRVLGRVLPVRPEELVGRSSVVAVDRDHRGNSHYRFLAEVLAPEQMFQVLGQGLEWSGGIAVFPRVDGLPPDLIEPGPDYLLGRPEDTSAEVRRLELCFRAVRSVLQNPPEVLPLDQHPEAADRLRRALRSPQVRSALLEVVEPATRHILVRLAGEEGSPPPKALRLAPALLDCLTLPEGQQVAALLVLQALCSSPRVRIGGLHREWQPEAFQSLLQESLFYMAMSDSVELRSASWALLATEALGVDRSRREAAAYLLMRHLEGLQGEEAARALAALALAPTVPLPPAVEIAEPGFEVGTREREEAELAGVRADLEAWLATSGGSGEIPARANLKGEDHKILALARLLVRLNRSWRLQEEAGRDRHLAVLAPGLEQVLRQSMLQAWTAFAEARGTFLSRLVGSRNKEVYQDYLTFLDSGTVRLPHPPRLDLPVEVLPAGETLGVGASPLFLRLAALIPATGDHKGPSLLELPDASPAQIALDPGRCRVFSMDAPSWRDFLATGVVSDRSSMQILEELYRSLAPGRPAPPSPPPRPPVSPPFDPPEADLEGLAQGLSHTFNLPRERHSAALTILVGLAGQSVRPLPPRRSV
jgi:hypothetical protein